MLFRSIIASQAEIHARYGGVVPEVAARSHIEVILPVIDEALSKASCSWDDIDAIAVTTGPGLIGSLIIDVMSARTLAITKNKPLVAINHIWAHAFASFLGEHRPEFPFLALTVSGGHTTLSLYDADLGRKLLGETLDDAAGEAFDKVAKLLGLGYPCGPAISEAATKGNQNAYKFPVAKLGKNSLDFSFSGLKTAVLRQIQQISGENPGAATAKKTYGLSESVICDIAASFQKAVVDALVNQTLKAYLRYSPKALVVGGGVACNHMLRQKLTEALPNAVFVPPVLCTDNAAMIGALAQQKLNKGLTIDPYLIKADSSLEAI